MARRTERRCIGWLAAVTTAAGDWPTAGHDNRRTGVTAEHLAPPLQLAWMFRSPAPPAAGWPPPANGYGARKNKSEASFDDAPRVIAAEGLVWFCSTAENALYAIDAATGRIRWTWCGEAAPRLAPTWHGGRLYFGADDGRVYGSACLLGYDPDKIRVDKYGRQQPGALVFHWFNGRQAAFTPTRAFEPGAAAAGQRMFDVLLQGQEVLDDFDVVLSAGGPCRAVIQEFSGVHVTGELTIGLRRSAADSEHLPILCAVEALREAP